MEIINLGKADGLPPVEWAAVAGKLEAGAAPAPDAANSRTTWLSTVNEDGSPHVTAVGALWLEGTFWFQTGAGTRKGRNVARDPRCSIAVSIRGADVVLEGDAVRVTEPGAVARIAKAWAENGWPAEPDDSGAGITAPFNAPSLGPPADGQPQDVAGEAAAAVQVTGPQEDPAAQNVHPTISAALQSDATGQRERARSRRYGRPIWSPA
jgi:hypothetical protein